MREALFPLGALAFLAFFVYRWAGDELARERRLSLGAATALVALFILHAMMVVLAALGGVVLIDAPVGVAIVLGAIPAVGGAALAVVALRALGSKERALAIDFGSVVTRGPYRRERHPFYAGWILALLGVAIAGRSGFALGLVVVLSVVLIVVARFEERLLAAEFGAEYERYRGRTPAVAVLRRPSPSD